MIGSADQAVRQLQDVYPFQAVHAPSVVAGHLTAIYSELGTLESFAHTQPNPYTLMLTFPPFFARYPELRDTALGVNAVG